MPTLYSNVLQIAFSVMIVVLVAYGTGRLHQWYRHCLDRDQAFREGYNHASHALFALATRGRGPGAAGPARPSLVSRTD